MKAKEFNAIVEARIDKIRQLTAAKAAEYASKDDRLYNFKRGAGLRKDRTPIQVCLDYLTKPLVSTLDILESDDPGSYSEAVVSEKIGDTIMYLILAEGILAELRGPSKKGG